MNSILCRHSNVPSNHDAPCSLTCSMYRSEVSASTRGGSHSRCRQPPICSRNTTRPGVSALSEKKTNKPIVIFITARKWSLRRLCFDICHSVHGGGVSAPVHSGIHPRDQRQIPPQDQRHTPPLHSACWEIRTTSGSYASYWNTYLLKQFLWGPLIPLF